MYVEDVKVGIMYNVLDAHLAEQTVDQVREKKDSQIRRQLQLNVLLLLIIHKNGGGM